MEDTLFAGAVISELSKNPVFTGLADSSIAAMKLYELAKDDLFSFLSNTSHRRRLEKLSLDRDIAYCLQMDISDKVPTFKGNALSL